MPDSKVKINDNYYFDVDKKHNKLNTICNKDGKTIITPYYESPTN